ncbi:MAG: DUF790 family protein, partial [Synechococcales bacterium]|nr:DUF790 family protein [Synechococcales bacterium]
MLPTELLVNRPSGDALVPKRVALNEQNRAIATDLIEIFQAHQGKTQGELNQQLQELEGEETDYRFKRGLAHLLRSGFSTFDVVSPLEPQDLRQRVFAAASRQVPLPQPASETLG